MAAGGWDAGVPLLGGRNGSGWDQRDQYIHLQEEEYSGTVHQYAPHSIPMPGGEEEGRFTGTKAVVGAEGPGLPRDTGGRGSGWGGEWAEEKDGGR